MENINISAVIEAILFASGEPIEEEKLSEAAGITKQELDEAIETLRTKYEAEDSALSLLKLENAYQLAAKEDYAPFIKAALEIKKNSVLSPAAMEALTIVAYNQPVTKGFVEQVRGVDSSGVVNSLVEKGLLTEARRLDLPGRPIAYKTTDSFLRAFRLSSIKDLPELPEQKQQISFDELLENEQPGEE
ncbi:MAG: SMC-Scp complex subunit ScpB [Ruminococcus sp.]|nr:SMC-Scp complex subunit ScpB [Ruminococcus sp.]